jgi:hypothetical protein
MIGKTEKKDAIYITDLKEIQKEVNTLSSGILKYSYAGRIIHILVVEKQVMAHIMNKDNTGIEHYVHGSKAEIIKLMIDALLETQ